MNFLIKLNQSTIKAVTICSAVYRLEYNKIYTILKTVLDFALDDKNRIIGKVDNIDANRHEAIREKIIKDIRRDEKKRKKEEKRLRIEKIKVRFYYREKRIKYNFQGSRKINVCFIKRPP